MANSEERIKPAVLCVHGYGVRGYSWQWLRGALAQDTAVVETPDLNMGSIDAMIADARERVQELAARQDGPIALVGHSLGAAILSILTQEKLPERVKGAILIAPPFGQQAAPGPIMSFLLQKQLIPQFLVRPRFFSRKTPKARQKEIFNHAVPESDKLRDSVFAAQWFHNDKLTGKSSVPALVVASDADKVVSSGQSKELAERIGAETWISPQSDNIGHDDYLAAPLIVDRLAREVVRFIEQYEIDAH